MSLSVQSKEVPASPPLRVKQVIEKSVAYIRKNGPSFEEKLRQNDTNNQFAFLSPQDPHHLYYKHRLSTANNTEPKNLVNPSNVEDANPNEVQKPHQLLFLTELPPISNHDLDVIKATALYVACNSKKHMEAFHRFMDRKGRRNQFAFMNKSHTLHGLFQSYIEQYLAIVRKNQNVPGDETSSLIDEYLSLGESDFLQKAYERAAYEKRHKIKKKTEEQETKNHQLHYALIDWQDFAFVSKFSFDAIDEVSELALPLLRESVIYRSLEAKSKDLQLEKKALLRGKSADQQEKDEKAESGENLENDKKTQKAPVNEIPSELKPPNVPKGMKIKAAGESRLRRKEHHQKQAQNSTIRCPITGKLISENEFDTHLKSLLRDPRYKEQQENYMRKNFTYESNLTTDQVYENIKRLVRKRNQSEEEEEEAASAAKRISLG